MPKKSGFTLIELLIVITIIAVLSLIGLTVYGAVQKGARDARRRADISAIADAMETHYGKTTVDQYDTLATTMFSSGSIPLDPINTNNTPESICPGVCKYCVRQGLTAQTGAACATTTDPTATPYTPVISGGSNDPYWVVCANLEGGGSYCRANSQ